MPALSEAQQAWLEFLNSPGVYSDGVDAIGEPSRDENGDPFVVFQDGKKLIQFTLTDDANSYESKILNPVEIESV
jgi:hypothetical protein